MEQVLNQVMPYLVSLLVGGLSYLISYIQTKTVKMIIKSFVLIAMLK